VGYSRSSSRRTRPDDAGPGGRVERNCWLAGSFLQRDDARTFGLQIFRNENRMKPRFYPDVKKRDLFSDGYIAARSSHSRGSIVDLTLVVRKDATQCAEIDMGTGFDFFGPESWPTSMQMTGSQRAHRILLQVLMKRESFVPYPQEWWHITLENEPFPDTYFDFVVD